jgi:hypothetical protein
VAALERVIGCSYARARHHCRPITPKWWPTPNFERWSIADILTPNLLVDD